MNYVDPASVISPQDKVSDVEVIYDGGEGSWSVAKLKWAGTPDLGIRWNGSYNNQPTGLPQSRGYPTWFIVPEELQGVIVNYCDANKNRGDFIKISPPNQEDLFRLETYLLNRLNLNPFPCLRTLFDDAAFEWKESNYNQKINELKRIIDADPSFGLTMAYSIYQLRYQKRPEVLERVPHALLALIEYLIKKQK